MTGVVGINHVTLCCSPAQLHRVKDFYEQVIGLATGARPAFDFPGAWLYAGEDPIVHLAAVLREATAEPDSGPSSRSTRPGGNPSTGSIDHVALRASGPVETYRSKLATRGIRFTEAPVPGFALHQLFLIDPLGVKIELNFELKS